VLDADGDEELTFAEVLGADILAAIRGLPQLPPVSLPASGMPIGDDDALQQTAQGYLAWLDEFLELGIANEHRLPSVPIAGMTGDARGLVAAVPRTLLQALTDTIAGLDTRSSPAGDMTGANMTVNDAHKRILMQHAARILPHFERGRTRVVREHLEWLKVRADGDDSPPDWIVGPTADRLEARIDRLLALLSN
jgi:hypothetical protein